MIQPLQIIYSAQLSDTKTLSFDPSNETFPFMLESMGMTDSGVYKDTLARDIIYLTYDEIEEMGDFFSFLVSFSKLEAANDNTPAKDIEND